MGRVKTYEELKFTDDFMFCKILESREDLCKELVELILGVKIEIVHSIGKQRPIEITPDNKGIRMDVYMEGDDKIFNVEMQNAHVEDLPRRARYYQSACDIEMLEKGAKYNDLKDSYIIFICTFDPFNQGLSKYTVVPHIVENPEAEYNDGTTKVFLSSAVEDDEEISEGLRDFLNYIGGRETTSDLAGKLEAALADAKSKKKWSKEYMFLYEIEDAARAEGREEGLAEGRARMLYELVSDKKISLEEASKIANLSADEFIAEMKKEGFATGE